MRENTHKTLLETGNNGHKRGTKRSQMVTNWSQMVTHCHKWPQIVTNRHKWSQLVTTSHARSVRADTRFGVKKHSTRTRARTPSTDEPSTAAHQMLTTPPRAHIFFQTFLHPLKRTGGEKKMEMKMCIFYNPLDQTRKVSS